MSNTRAFFFPIIQCFHIFVFRVPHPPGKRKIRNFPLCFYLKKNYYGGQLDRNTET